MNTNKNENSLLLWVTTGIVYLAIIATTTFIKTTDEIIILLEIITKELELYSLFVHVFLLIVLIIAVLRYEIRDKMLIFFIAFLSFSALIVSIIYFLLPNTLIFGLILFGIILAYKDEELTFGIDKMVSLDTIVGSIGLLIGFWYLHWVEEPIFVNAIFYSPLGSINCPTLVAICSVLCFAKQPRSRYLEVVVALITIFFGFFGILLLGAYIDIVLILCGTYLLSRNISLKQEK